MSLTIENAEVERLVEEVSNSQNKTKTIAIRVALEERKLRLQLHPMGIDRGERAFAFFREGCLALPHRRRVGKAN